MVKTYSLKADGEKQLSPHFKVKEFACHDGSDKILIDDGLVHALEIIRAKYGKAIKINSAYRSPSYNERINGAPHSQHLLGRAADIRIDGIKPLEIAKYADHLCLGGVGLYPAFTHVDVRVLRSRWEDVSSLNGVSTFLPMPTDVLEQGSKGDGVIWLQAYLVKHGYKLTVDGCFGAATHAAVDDFQHKHGLKVDGVVGKNTRAKLLA